MQGQIAADRPMMSTESAANYCGCAASTLKTYRSRQCGPAFYRTGKRILYKQSDLDVWLESRRVDPTSPATIQLAQQQAA